MTSKCCHMNCNAPANFRIEWGEVANPDNFTDACEQHVGVLLGHHPQQMPPDHYRVYPVKTAHETNESRTLLDEQDDIDLHDWHSDR